MVGSPRRTIKGQPREAPSSEGEAVRGDAGMDASVATEMKRQAKAWQEKLHKEFYDEANTIGRKGMYLVLKKKSPIDYPTKSFVGAWLRRQISKTN